MTINVTFIATINVTINVTFIATINVTINVMQLTMLLTLKIII